MSYNLQYTNTHAFSVKLINDNRKGNTAKLVEYKNESGKKKTV